MKKFQRGTNPGTQRCVCCKSLKWAGRIDGSTSLCPVCYDSAGTENSHQDGHHEDGCGERCPVALNVGCLHEVSA